MILTRRMGETMKKILIKFFALLNVAEGIIHITVAGISFWGIWDLNTWDWRVLTAPTENLFFGLFSLLTGWLLGEVDVKQNQPKE